MYYPVLFEKDLLTKPVPVKLNQQNYVLWKSTKGIHALPNRCSHRGARLSDGRMVGSRLECPYHGWQFQGNGKCTKIPQWNVNQKIPGACHLNKVFTHLQDGIVWVSHTNGLFQPYTTSYNNNPNYFVSNYYLEAPYNYYLQIENLLDPAHLHFTHHGFQGNRERASEIKLTKFLQNNYELYGYFEHTNKDTPDIEIRFIKPSIVDVSIFHKTSKQLLRKNIIYVSPRDHQTCNVLFRDVALKDTLIPKSNFFMDFHGKLMLNQPFVQDHYQFINQEVIERIMDQDIQVLVGQQLNDPNYETSKYVMPTESDRLILEFRKWIKNITVK
jgi:phenylpropionate dioxygenase-like ring-hydroxylating dioxygenase large terminal subunit